MSDPRAETAVRLDTRRRILAAFVTQGRSGVAPAGRQTRSLAVGVAAAVLLLVGGAVSARLTPTASSGTWSDGDVVIGRASAARLVSIAGVLHPLLNTASGRLLLPASSRSRVVVVDDSVIAVARRGAPVGIPGAPDVLPAPPALVQTGWLACLDGSRVTTRITAPAGEAATWKPTGERAVVVAVTEHPDELYLVVGDHRYLIPAASYPAVKQYLDQTRAPRPAPSRWVDLFPLGTSLTFGSFRFGPSVAVGQSVPTTLRPPSTVKRLGQLVTNTDRANAPFVIVADGTVPLTAFAAAVYRATAPDDLATPVALTDADLARLPPSPTVGFTPPDWPESLPLAAPVSVAALEPGRASDSTGSPSGVPSGAPSGAAVGATCAELGAGVGRPPTTHLRFDAPFSPDAGVSTTAGPGPSTAAGVAPQSGASTRPPVVGPSGGAVVTVHTGADDASTVYLVDPSGSAFPIGDPTADTIARLGYSGVVPPIVPAAWIALCPVGPELDAAVAQVPATSSTSS